MLIKTILLGDKAVGKTHLLNHLRGINYSHYMPTVGVDFFEYNMSGKKLHIWDSSGSLKYAGVTRTFVRSTSLFLIVYNNKRSFDKISGIMEMIDILCEKDKRIMLISLTADAELECEGQTLASIRRIPFLSCNVNNRSDAIILWHTILDICDMEINLNKWSIAKRKVPPIVEKRNCWWWFGS